MVYGQAQAAAFAKTGLFGFTQEANTVLLREQRFVLFRRYSESAKVPRSDPLRIRKVPLPPLLASSLSISIVGGEIPSVGATTTVEAQPIWSVTVHGEVIEGLGRIALLAMLHTEIIQHGGRA